jgi:hypothetical protein
LAGFDVPVALGDYTPDLHKVTQSKERLFRKFPNLQSSIKTRLIFQHSVFNLNLDLNLSAFFCFVTQ